MARSTVLQEVRIMRFEEVYGGFQVGRLGCEDAAELLGVSVSAFYRYRRRFEAEGAEQPGSSFVPDRLAAYRDILCVHEERTVAGDNTVRYDHNGSLLENDSKLAA